MISRHIIRVINQSWMNGIIFCDKNCLKPLVMYNGLFFLEMGNNNNRHNGHNRLVKQHF